MLFFTCFGDYRGAILCDCMHKVAYFCISLLWIMALGAGKIADFTVQATSEIWDLNGTEVRLSESCASA